MRPKRLVSHLVKFTLPIIAVGIIGCGPAEEPPEPLTADETDPARFAEFYPFQYETFMRTKEMEETKYGGSYNYSYVERLPHLERIFGSIGYGLDYNRARGHYWAMSDMLSIKRSPKFVSCFTCKSADVPQLIAELGDAYYTTLMDEFLDIGAEIEAHNENPYLGVKHASISCSDCHHPETMDLRITRPALKEALERRGTPVETLSRNDMRSVVCAQCHVEYYFHPDPNNRKLIFPWDEGFDPADMERYFDYRFTDMEQFAETGFYDYRHPQADVPLRIIQHPEFEMFQGGTHQVNNVSCADCHMPVVRIDGRNEISHHITSPLKYISETCQQCHNQTAEWLENRVYAAQERTLRMRGRAEQAMLAALDALEAANNRPETDRTLLSEAQQAYTSAHLRWQYVKAENSVGWHNPQKALETLGEAVDYAHRAREKAQRAMGGRTIGQAGEVTGR
jgi:nitrite reductase (cytochrome c-552)